MRQIDSVSHLNSGCIIRLESELESALLELKKPLVNDNEKLSVYKNKQGIRNEWETVSGLAAE